MRSRSLASSKGFTLVELIISLSLSLIVFAAVFSSYLFLARNFTRQLGVSSANQPTLQSQAARTLATFEQDVRMSEKTDGTISETQLTLVVATNSGSKRIYYYYNNSDSPTDPAVPLGDVDVVIPARTLARKDSGTGSVQWIHSSVLTCRFSFFDQYGRPFTILSSGTAGYSDLRGIKQVSLAFTSQSGSRANGTLTPVYSYATPRMGMRNQSLPR